MARGGIRLTLGGWGHSVSAHWLEARARAPFSRLATRTNAISRTNRELRDLSDERATFKCVAPRGLPESPGGLNMTKRIAGLLVIVLAVILVPAALPQIEPTPTVYTFVSQFQ